MNAEAQIHAVAAEVADELHDAVFDPSAWERMVAVIGNWKPQLRPLLHVESINPAKVELAKYVGWDPDLVRSYAEDYADQNVFRPSIASTGIDEVGVSTDTVSEREVMRSAFYADILLKADDVRSASGFLFARNPDRFAVLGFHYPHAQQEELLPLGVKLQAIIARPSRSAFALALRAAARDNEREVGAAINSLAIPALVLDEEGRVVRANELGAPMLTSDDLVRVTAKGHLEALTPQDSARLRASFARTLSERRMVTCPFTAPSGAHAVAHFVPMRRTEATDPFISGFIDAIDPAAIVYFRVGDA